MDLVQYTEHEPLDFVIPLQRMYVTLKFSEARLLAEVCKDKLAVG
jgi:hypothetical protein